MALKKNGESEGQAWLHGENVPHWEQASQGEEKLRAQENEEKLRKELQRMKQMFVMYDESIGYPALLRRTAKKQEKSSEACEEILPPETGAQDKLKRLDSVLQRERASNKEAELRAKGREQELRKELETLEKRNALMEERYVRLNGVASLALKNIQSIKVTNNNLTNKNEELTLLLEHEKSCTAALQINVSEMQRTLVSLQVESTKLKESYTEAKEQLKREVKANVALRVKIQYSKEQLEKGKEVCQSTGGQSEQQPEEGQRENKQTFLKPSDKLNLNVAQLQSQEPSLNRNQADGAAPPAETSKVQTKNSSKEEEEVKKEEEVKEEEEEEVKEEEEEVDWSVSDCAPSQLTLKKTKNRYATMPETHLTCRVTHLGGYFHNQVIFRMSAVSDLIGLFDDDDDGRDSPRARKTPFAPRCEAFRVCGGPQTLFLLSISLDV
ncbi:hypothetical protein F2P81_012488 [Scophthalmus maximus]|uniref:Uncharacterized protein n=1 Tax=Scophthalmus maximus TaxID=52904 RepID=A0A6A4SS88_SCOMX|nr:hypothetical protein F2P81_012488 [Scophthalmus maximus]